MTIAVGLITEPRQAESMLQDGHADLMAMARELMVHADWPLRAAKELQRWSLRPDGAIHRAPAASPRRAGGRVPAGQRSGDPGGGRSHGTVSLAVPALIRSA